MTEQLPLPRANSILRNATTRFLRHLLIALGALLLWQGEARATHAMGGELTYECIGAGIYRVRLSFYRDCNGVAAPTNCSNGRQFRLRSAACGNGSNTVTLNPCFSLDGVDDHCTVASAATIDVGGGVTLTAWVRSRAAVSGVNPTIFVFWSSSGPSAYVRVNGRRFQFLAASGFVLAETEVPFGQWAHIALTSDGKNAQWFLIGKASGVGPVTMPLTALRAVYIGQDSSAAQRYNGEIDQLRLFRGVLSVGEVADVMNER